MSTLFSSSSSDGGKQKGVGLVIQVLIAILTALSGVFAGCQLAAVA